MFCPIHYNGTGTEAVAINNMKWVYVLYEVL